MPSSLLACLLVYWLRGRCLHRPSGSPTRYARSPPLRGFLRLDLALVHGSRLLARREVAPRPAAWICHSFVARSVRTPAGFVRQLRAALDDRSDCTTAGFVREVRTALDDCSILPSVCQRQADLAASFGKRENRLAVWRLWRGSLLQAGDRLSVAVSFVLALSSSSEGERLFALSAFVEPLVVFLILVVNAAVGIWQETNAEKALHALREISPPTLPSSTTGPGCTRSRRGTSSRATSSGSASATSSPSRVIRGFGSGLPASFCRRRMTGLVRSSPGALVDCSCCLSLSCGLLPASTVGQCLSVPAPRSRRDPALVCSLLWYSRLGTGLLRSSTGFHHNPAVVAVDLVGVLLLPLDLGHVILPLPLFWCTCSASSRHQIVDGVLPCWCSCAAASSQITAGPSLVYGCSCYWPNHPTEAMKPIQHSTHDPLCLDLHHRGHVGSTRTWVADLLLLFLDLHAVVDPQPLSATARVWSTVFFFSVG